MSKYFLICSNVFGPVDRNHFISAADTPQKSFAQEKKVHYHGDRLLCHTRKIDHKLVSSCAEKCAEFNGVKITLIES